MQLAVLMPMTKSWYEILQMSVRRTLYLPTYVRTAGHIPGVTQQFVCIL